MTRFLSIILTLLLTFTSHTHAETGKLLGHTVFSGVGTYINNYPINSYTVNGWTAVLVQDLYPYGFATNWDERTRSISITRDISNEIRPQTNVYKNQNRSGQNHKPIYLTDITATVNGNPVPCMNIDGCAAIYFDDLGHLGSVFWDAPNSALKLTVDGLPITEFSPIPENPNVTTIYSYSKKTMLVGNEELQAYLDAGWLLTPPPEKMIALTFDDGPSTYTTQILNTLEKYGAKATFFVVGNRVANHSAILLRAHNLGMEIGNHSYSHPKLTTLSSSAILSQKNNTENAIKAVTGQGTKIMRPPYGSRNDTVLSVYNMPAILWSVDTLDWKTRDTQKIVNSVMTSAKDGDIILMHDLYSATADAVEIIVPTLIEEGYSLVTVSQLAEAKLGGLSVKAYSQMR